MTGSKTAARRAGRARRHARVLRKIRGTAERPRLVVHRSLRHMEGQLVDDDRRITLLGVSTLSSKLDEGEAGERSGKVADSFRAGVTLARLAREAGVGRVVFDRGGYRYHGRVRAFAEGARAGGLEF